MFLRLPALRSALSAAVIALVVSSGAVAAPSARLTPTSGAVTLNAAQMKSVEGTLCGLVGKKWLPGATVKRAFLSHSKRAANLSALAKRASGRRAASLRAEAATSSKLHKAQVAACAQPNGARKLAASKLRKAGSDRSAIQCGNLRGWVPGTLSAGYFTAHSQQATNFTTLARFSKGTAKRAAQAQAAAFRGRASSELAACRGGGASDMCPNIAGVQTSVPAGKVKDDSGQCVNPPAPLRLNLSGAAGLALSAPGSANSPAPGQPGSANAAGDAGSNLDVVTPDGQVREAITSGTATVSRFLIAPNGKAYLLFQNKVSLADTGKIGTDGACLLAELSPNSETPTCVDSTLSSIQWNTSNMVQAPPIQFDGSGAIYYLGTNSANKTVLRRYSVGVITDLITDNVSVAGYYVLPDGNVLVGGQTTSTSANWLRRISPTGGISSLSSDYFTSMLPPFPDGNVYFFQHVGAQPQIGRYLTSGSVLDTMSWMRQAGNPDPTTHNNMYLFDSGCGGCWVGVRAMATTLSDKVFVLNGANPNNGRLMQYYPVLGDVASAVAKPSALQGVLNHLIIAGLNGSGQNVMYLHDTTDSSETELLGPSNEIEIYHLNYAAAGSKVMFDGLRFADNTYVLGEVNVNTGEARVTAALGAKWDDFQTFG